MNNNYDVNANSLGSPNFTKFDGCGGSIESYCGLCFRAIYSDRDSDLLELLSPDCLCQCESDA